MRRYFGGATVGEVGRMFSKINTDGDARLTWAEWCAAVGVDDEDVGGAGLVVTGVRVDDGTAATRIQAKHRGKLSRQKTQGLKTAAAAAGAPETGEAVAEDEKIVVRITRGDEMTALDGENRELRARVKELEARAVEVNNLAAALPTADLPRPTTAVREATVQKSELRRLCRLAGIETSISDEVEDLVAKLDAGGSPLKGTISTGFAKGGGGGGKGGAARPLSARAEYARPLAATARPAPLRPQSAVAARRAPATVGAAPRHRAAPTYDYTSSPQAGRPAARLAPTPRAPPPRRARRARLLTGRRCCSRGASTRATTWRPARRGRRRRRRASAPRAPSSLASCATRCRRCARS